MRRTVFGLIVAGALALALPAVAAGTKDRLLLLEQEVADLKAAAPSTSASALKIGQLEEQIETLTGRVEELSYQLDQANARLTAVTAALSGGAAAGLPIDLGASDPIAGKIADASTPAGSTGALEMPIDADAAFDYASSFLRTGDYARARDAFKLYLQAFPNHPRTADAQFRLGEIYLATGADADAADAFIAHIKKYPKDPRAAEAYLKLGAAFARLNQTTEACKVLKTMKAKFPGAAPVILQRADVEMSRIGCK